jgi:hypothetical protein
MLADPPKDKLWMLEEGFVVVLGLAAGGESDAAFDLVERLMDLGGVAQFARIEASPVFDGLRQAPRYLALQQRYRDWRAKAGM